MLHKNTYWKLSQWQMQAIAYLTVFSLFFIRTILKGDEHEIWQNFKNKRTILGWIFFLKIESIRLYALLTTLYWCSYVWHQKQILKKVLYVSSLTFSIIQLFNQPKVCLKTGKKIKSSQPPKKFTSFYKRMYVFKSHHLSLYIRSRIHQ